MNLINLSKDVQIVLTKRNIPNVLAQVGCATDVSGSMRPLFKSGAVQETLDRLFAVAHKFDDNKTLDSWVFDNSVYAIEPIVAGNIDGYAEKEIVNGPKRREIWCGTSYAPALTSMFEFYTAESTVEALQREVTDQVKSVSGFIKGLFGKPSTAAAPVVAAPTGKKLVNPAFAIFITDGQSDDESATQRVLQQYAKSAVYVQLVGIGGGSFPFLKKMADTFPNCGYSNVADLAKLSPSDMYEELISEEFAAWYNAFRATQSK